jgi:arylformamidase
MILFTDFETEYKVKEGNRIKSIVPVAGLFDLRPLLKTYVNDALKMNEEESAGLSPLLRTKAEAKKDVYVLIASADEDSPAFQSQSEQFSKV